MNKKTFIEVLVVVIISSSCSPHNDVTQARTDTPVPASTLVPLLQVTGSMQRLETPTEFRLPYNNQNIEHEYCQYPPVKLSTSDALELTEDEIVEKLMDFHLAYFNTALAPENCRIAGYKIDQIYYDQRTPNLPLEL